MAKENKRSVHNASVLFIDSTETSKVQNDPVDHTVQEKKSKRFWSNLSRGGQIGTIAVILFVAMGAMGAGLKYLEDSAKRQKATQDAFSDQSNSSSYLASLNPFVVAPTPVPTPQLSKEYIYAGSRMLAVEDATAAPAPPTDLAVWRPSTGYWYVMGGPGSQQTFTQWGGTDDTPVPGDYDGDGKTDFSVFRKTPGNWYVLYSSNGNSTVLNSFGASTDKMAQADYDGDGKTDMAVYRPNTGYWYLMLSSTNSMVAYQWGVGDHTPVPADYDGDGKADIAVWYNAGAVFQILKSSTNFNTGNAQTIAFGQPGDKPVPGDYDGDGKTDVAVWKGNGVNQWHARYSSTQTTYATSLGDPNSDIAVQNDYDGDGKTDMAIWRPSDGMWYIQQSTNGPRSVQWGMLGDVPVPAFYRRR